MKLRCLVLLLLGCIWASSSAFAADKVTLRLDWVYGSEHAPIFLARDKGFFKEEGIDIQILPGQGSTVTVKLVGNGTADFGYAAADTALMAYAKGLPVISTAVILQKSPSAIIFPAASRIKTLKDLYGKTLGDQYHSTVEKQWRAVEEINGIDPSKIHEVVADRAVAKLIENKTIDAGVAFFFNDGLKVEADGIPMKWILFSDVGLQMYSTSLLTSTKMIKEKPDLVRRFTRAFVKGWTYSLNHEKEALNIFLKDNPTIDAKYSALKLPQVLKLTQDQDTEQHGIGYSTKAKWEAMQKALIHMGLMKDAVDVSDVFTNKYLEE